MARDLRSIRRASLALVLVITASFSWPFAEVLAQEEPVHLDLRLMGADLVDELVFNWTQNPPFEQTVDLTLAGVDAPIGLDERFAVFVENRLYELLRVNANIPLQLVHCSVCRRMIVTSTPEKTVFSRGIDQPEILSGLLKTSPDQKALHLAFEVEGRELVLRATIFELKGSQAILWARTFSTSMTARRLLRESSPLISLEQAREEQRILLDGKDPLQLTTRMTIRVFSLASGAAAGAVEIAPLVFVEQAFEGILLPRRDRRLGISLGFTSIKEALEGWTVGGQYHHLLWRDRPSLVHPDLYLLLGFHYMRLRGPQALPFGQEQLDIDSVLISGREPKASLVAWRLGVETHIKHRYGFLTFLEYVPLLNRSEVLASNRLFGIPYHAFGGGMVIRW